MIAIVTMLTNSNWSATLRPSSRGLCCHHHVNADGVAMMLRAGKLPLNPCQPGMGSKPCPVRQCLNLTTASSGIGLEPSVHCIAKPFWTIKPSFIQIQVSKDGVFTRKTMPQITYLTMTYIRVTIPKSVAWQLSIAVTIATRYSAVRRQTANSKG